MAQLPTDDLGGDAAFNARFGRIGLTFDDVLLMPAESNVLPHESDTSTWFTPDIRLAVPIVSAAMDTVTESRMAVALAQEGGIGIVHKNLTPKQQAAEVALVKRYESGLLRDPITVGPDTPVREVIALTKQHGFSGFPVLEGKAVVGIVTNRDLRFETRLDAPVREVMTPREKLISVREGTSLEEGKALMHRHKLERVLVVNEAFELRGLMTVKDITKQTDFPAAARDAQGKLRVAAAVGPGGDRDERVQRLVDAGVDPGAHQQQQARRQPAAEHDRAARLPEDEPRAIRRVGPRRALRVIVVLAVVRAHRVEAREEVRVADLDPPGDRRGGVTGAQERRRRGGDRSRAHA